MTTHQHHRTVASLRLWMLVGVPALILVGSAALQTVSAAPIGQQCSKLNKTVSIKIFSPVAFSNGSISNGCQQCEATLCQCMGGTFKKDGATGTTFPVTSPLHFCALPSSSSSNCTKCQGAYPGCKANLATKLQGYTSSNLSAVCISWRRSMHVAVLGAATEDDSSYVNTTLRLACADVLCNFANTAASSCSSTYPSTYVSAGCSSAVLLKDEPTLAPPTSTPAPNATNTTTETPGETTTPAPNTTQVPTSEPTTPVPPTPAPIQLTPNMFYMSLNATKLLVWYRSLEVSRNPVPALPSNVTEEDVVESPLVKSMLAQLISSVVEFYLNFRADPEAWSTAQLAAITVTGSMSVDLPTNATRLRLMFNTSVPPVQSGDWVPALYIVTVSQYFPNNGSVIPSTALANQLIEFLNNRAERPAFFSVAGLLGAASHTSATFPPMKVPPLKEKSQIWGSPREPIGLGDADESGVELWLFLVLLAASAIVGALIAAVVVKFVIATPDVPPLRQRLLEEPVLQKDKEKEAAGDAKPSTAAV